MMMAPDHLSAGLSACQYPPSRREIIPKSFKANDPRPYRERVAWANFCDGLPGYGCDTKKYRLRLLRGFFDLFKNNYSAPRASLSRPDQVKRDLIRDFYFAVLFEGDRNLLSLFRSTQHRRVIRETMQKFLGCEEKDLPHPPLDPGRLGREQDADWNENKDAARLKETNEDIAQRLVLQLQNCERQNVFRANKTCMSRFQLLKKFKDSEDRIQRTPAVVFSFLQICKILACFKDKHKLKALVSIKDNVGVGSLTSYTTNTAKSLFEIIHPRQRLDLANKLVYLLKGYRAFANDTVLKNWDVAGLGNKNFTTAGLSRPDYSCELYGAPPLPPLEPEASSVSLPASPPSRSSSAEQPHWPQDDAIDADVAQEMTLPTLPKKEEEIEPIEPPHKEDSSSEKKGRKRTHDDDDDRSASSTSSRRDAQLLVPLPPNYPCLICRTIVPQLPVVGCPKCHTPVKHACWECHGASRVICISIGCTSLTVKKL